MQYLEEELWWGMHTSPEIQSHAVNLASKSNHAVEVILAMTCVIPHYERNIWQLSCTAHPHEDLLIPQEVSLEMRDKWMTNTNLEP